MERFKSIFFFYVLPFVAVFVVLLGCNLRKSSAMQFCDHPYALCTSALCIPQPGNPDKAICFCDVEEGKSMSTVSCNQLQPTTDSTGIRTIYSTFSFKQYGEGKKGMKCPSGTPWTWCLNKRCTIDPSNSKKAICSCDVIRTSGEWMTLGGDCDPSTCKTGYWSGVDLGTFEKSNIFLTKALRLDQSPVKWCQRDSF